MGKYVIKRFSRLSSDTKRRFLKTAIGAGAGYVTGMAANALAPRSKGTKGKANKLVGTIGGAMLANMDLVGSKKNSQEKDKSKK